MTALQVASVYIAVNILILVWLAVRVVARRFKGKISVGDGGSESFAMTIRAHANATEYTPAMLIGLLALAFLNVPAWVVHVLGGGFTLGRVLHPLGMKPEGPIVFRQIGMVLTWTAMILLAAGLLIHAFV